MQRWKLSSELLSEELVCSWDDYRIHPLCEPAFFKKLLALNMKLDHGAVAIDGKDLVLVDSVEGAGIHADEIHASVMALENGAQMIYNAIRKG